MKYISLFITLLLHALNIYFVLLMLDLFFISVTDDRLQPDLMLQNPQMYVFDLELYFTLEYAALHLIALCITNFCWLDLCLIKSLFCLSQMHTHFHDFQKLLVQVSTSHLTSLHWNCGCIKDP